LPGSTGAPTVRDVFAATTVPTGCTLAVGVLHGRQRTGLLYLGDRIAVRQQDARCEQGASGPLRSACRCRTSLSP
jgi:hypothetical protein